MAAPSSAGRSPLRAPLAVTVVLAVLLSACGPAKRTDTPVPPRVEEASPSPHTAGTALIDAEGVNAAFAAMPAAVDVAVKASPGAPPAEVAALRHVAERAWREEAAMLSDALAADATISPDAAGVVASLTALADAHDPAATAGPWTASRASMLDRALAASPHRQAITALSATMAASRFAGERALTARRMAWALDRARRGGPPLVLSDASDEIAAMIATTRQAEDARIGADAAGGADHALIQALLKLPAADIATLAAWYGSAQGKAARERLIGGIQGANDRAIRATLIDFLTRAGAGG